ncbi:MAG TPA: TIGR03435 family protein [Bryobacteraceae bacterium]|nr:TIGR03435 family protein [Bryobacteraceae bacterium]
MAICSAGLVYAQSFDVASIKPHPPSGDGRIRVMMGGGPGTPDPGRLNYENVSLKNMVTTAFDIKGYQLTGPVWLDSERFDVTAKIAPGATKEQFRTMLQNLLTDRFNMTFHREKKELSAFVLVVGKGGSKLKGSEETADDKDSAPAPQPGPGPMKRGKDGFPELPAGREGSFMSMMPGKAKLVANHASVSRLVEMLGNQLDRPVVDETGLKGNYDITLYFEPEMRGAPGGAMPRPGEGGAPPTTEGETYPTLITAIQEQLGLKLESKKAPIDLIVIDRMEKAPTEN